MADDIAEWWDSLSPDTRRRLAEDPHGFVPADLIAEVSQAGQLVIGTYWPDASPGPGGFELTGRVQEWIDANGSDR